MNLKISVQSSTCNKAYVCLKKKSLCVDKLKLKPAK